MSVRPAARLWPFLCAFLALPAAAAGPAWSTRVWSAGLASNNVNGLAQTADGFLWVGTTDGLARFDGLRFDRFVWADIFPGRPANLRGIVGLEGGGLWVSLTDGLGAMVGVPPPQLVTGMPGDPADTIVQDDEGAIWVTHGAGPVRRVKDGRVTSIGVSHGRIDESKCLLAKDARGRMWFHQGSHVGVIEAGRFRPLVTTPDGVGRLAGARTGGVWIVAGPQLLRYDLGGALEVKGTYPSEHSGARASSLLETRDGAVWIGTRHDGLFRYGPSGIESVPTSHGMIRALLEDREGNLWVGAGGGGLNRVLPRAMEIEGAETGLASRLVPSIAEDAAGVLWGATHNGRLVRRTNGDWQAVPVVGAATVVAADPGGGVWIGTRDRQVHLWRAPRLRSWGSAHGLAVHTVCALKVSRSGDVWLAGEGPAGVHRLRDGRFHTLALPEGTRYVRAIVEDTRGRLWFGADEGRLLRVAGEALVVEEAAASVVRQRIRALHAAVDGSLWIGYENGGGLGRLQEGRFARLGREQGLPGETVAQVIVDPRGWMLLGTDEGIFKLKRRDVDDVLEGRASRILPVRVGAGEAAFTLAGSTCGSSAAVPARSGSVWMPMGTATAIVHPDRLSEDLPAPAAVLTRVSVDGRTRAVYGGPVAPTLDGAPLVDLRGPSALRLRPHERRLEIEYTAPTFRAPENVRFRYRMEGLDADWADAGTGRSATFAHLPVGRYRFRVTACADGVCREDAAGLDLDVELYLWQTTSVRLAVFALFTAALVAVVRRVSFRRLRSRLQDLEWNEGLHKERARIARDIHDDIGNRLTTIVLLSGLAQRDITEAEKAGEHVRQIGAAARQVTDSLDEIVWAVNPRNDAVSQVVDYVGQFAVEFARTAGLRIRVDLPERPPARKVSAEVRHNLFLVVKEALNNVARHARARAVVLRVECRGELLVISLEDDGDGFAASAGGAGGDGLRNMRQRVEEVGGQWQVSSAPGAGTRLEFSMPLIPTKGA
jgi:signal transduction histidine kinase/ligand-binding sensor domain-containing protein